MRVLFVSNFYPPNFIGGAELVLHRHAVRLARLGHAVHVFAGEHSPPHQPLHSWQDEFEGIPVTRIQLTHRETAVERANFLNLPVARRLHALLREWRPDVVHFHNTPGLSLASYHHGARLGIPVVVTFHDHWGFCLRNTLITVENRLCLDRNACERCLPRVDAGRPVPISCRKDYLRRRFSSVSRFITPSAYLAGQYSRNGFPADKFHVVSNGFDPVLPAPRAAGAPVCRFTTICYLGEHKGVHLALKALAALPRDLPWEFNIVGIGHLEPMLRRLVRVSGLEHRVRFLGRLPNDQIPPVLAATDVYILASVWAENEPVSILEALAHGVPVIATNTGGVPELVWPGINGWLVPPADIPALRRVLHEAASDRDLVRRLAAGAIRTGSRWPEHRQVERLLDVYEEAIRTPGLQPAAPLVSISGHAMPDAAADALKALKAMRPDVDFLPQEWLEEDELRLVRAVLQVAPGDADPFPADLPRHLLQSPLPDGDWHKLLRLPAPSSRPTQGETRSAVFAKN